MSPDVLASIGWGGLAAIFGSLLFGGVLKGITGIGAALASVPVMAALTDLRLAVLVTVVPNLFTNLRQAVQHRESFIRAPFMMPFLGAVTLGVVVGTHLLIHLPERVLEYLISGMVLAFVAFRLARPEWQMGLKGAMRLSLPVGLISGVLQGATGIAGPPVIAFLNAMRPSREEFLATIATVFMVFAVVQIATLLVLGMLGMWLLILGFAALAVLLTGMEIGNRIARFIPVRAFDRLILVILSLVALKMMLGI
jgi:uncharacterized membrane protein YfcA